MPEAAQLRARNLVLPGFGRLEPNVNHAARNGVLLEAQVRDEKTVDDVLRRQIDPHDLVHGDVQLVVHRELALAEFAVGARVGDFPVELFRVHLVEHVARRPMLLDIGPGRAAHDSQGDQDNGGRRGPDHLETRITLDVLRLAAGPGAIADHEDHYSDHHRDPDDHHDPEDQLEEPVDPGTEGRNVVRKIQMLEHRSVTSALSTCESRTSVAAPIRAANANCQHVAIHEFGGIMPVSTTISEMKNPCPPPQPTLNQPRHDAHISPAISSASRSMDQEPGGNGNPTLAHDWRRQIFRLQPVQEEEVLVSYA